MILSVNRLDDFHFSFFGHSNAIVVYLSIMLLSLLECIRLQHVHSRLWLYWAQSDRFSNFNFYVKKGKKYTTQNKGQGSSQVPVTCNRGVRAVAYSRLAEAASTSNLEKGNKSSKNWLQIRGKNVQHMKLFSGIYKT